MRGRLVRGPLAELDGNAALRAISYRLGDFPDAPLPATLFLDGQLGLADDMLHYFDRASMAHSLEVRVPFLDHEFVELCASIPANLKVHRLETKHVLRHAARGLVPDRIIDKPKIGFFNAAVDGWFRAQANGAISDYLLAPNARYTEMIDRTAVERLLSEHTRGEGGNAYALLSILMLEVWLSEYLPRARAAVTFGNSLCCMSSALSYAVVTPVRNEADNIRRLAEALARQSRLPTRGSSSTPDRRIRHPRSSTIWPALTRGSKRGLWRRPISFVADRSPGRSSSALQPPPIRPDVVVKLDADTSFAPDYFERLLAEFAADPALGMASGTCVERKDGEWRERHVTGTTVWGASRAYRRQCLTDVLPLEQRMGWDGVDEFRANSRGWKTHTFKELPFRHHRREGERDGSPHRARNGTGSRGAFSRIQAVVSRASIAVACPSRAGGACNDLGLLAGRGEA